MPARLSTAAVSDIIRRRWLELEVARGVSIDTARQRAARFSSHSLRRGFCTSAAEAGLPFDAIRKRSRHADDGVLAGYIGEAEGRRHSGLKGLFNRERGR
jgi:integrase